MNQSKINTVPKSSSLVFNFAIVLTLIVLFPLLQNQILTGTLVNALLVLSVFLFGFSGAFLLTFIPSLISLSLGLLPSVMSPMVPFIFLGNLILISVIYFFKDKNYWLAGSIAASAKALFLFISGFVLFSVFFTGSGAKLVSSMMGYMQILTASLGIVLAYIILKIIKKI